MSTKSSLPGRKNPVVLSGFIFPEELTRIFYKERKNLGRALVPQILKAIDFELEKHGLFLYSPILRKLLIME